MGKLLLVGALLVSVSVMRGDSPDEVKANLNRSVGFPYRLYVVREPLPYTGQLRLIERPPLHLRWTLNWEMGWESQKGSAIITPGIGLEFPPRPLPPQPYQVGGEKLRYTIPWPQEKYGVRLYPSILGTRPDGNGNGWAPLEFRSSFINMRYVRVGASVGF